MLAAEYSPLQLFVRPLVETLTKGTAPSSYTSLVGTASNFANLGKINFVTNFCLKLILLGECNC